VKKKPNNKRPKMNVLISGAIRQIAYDGAIRIPEQQGRPAKVSRQAPPLPAPERSSASASAVSLIAELATCCWYLKTKFFKRPWASDDIADSDPRVRNALRKINACIGSLRSLAIELDDPIGKPYRTGSEGFMRPIQFVPTDGVLIETISDTVKPVIFIDGRPFQRGEVFVATPLSTGNDPALAGAIAARETAAPSNATTARPAAGGQERSPDFGTSERKPPKTNH
jgi:hypothetical protein